MNTRRLVAWCAALVCGVAASAQTSPPLNRQYRGHGIVFSYPEQWQAQEGGGGVTMAPAEAHRLLRNGHKWITLGLMAGSYQPRRQMEVGEATEELVARLQKGNPELRRTGLSRAVNISGYPGLVADYSNGSAADGVVERGVLLTVQAPGGLSYLMMFCPGAQSSTYLPVFSNIIRTVRMDTSGAVAAVENATSAVYIEPARTLVRQVVDVRAGYTQQYQLPLTRGSKLMAQFHVRGGLNNRVNVLLLDTANFQRYSARQQFTYFKGTSGMVRNVGSYQFLVPATDNYYLLIDNGKAWFMPRKVEIYAYELLSEATPEIRTLEKEFNKFYEQMKVGFIFPDFRISIRHCGLENAFSNPNITLCTELLEDLEEHHLESAIGFVLFHELGHTLLRGWGLPGYDNEDTADEFATVMMIMGHQRGAALQAAQWWASRTSTQEALSKIYVDDRHTISPQRARNIVRWLNSGDDLLKRWQRLLVPNMQTAQLQEELKGSQIDRELVMGELRKRGVATP